MNTFQVAIIIIIIIIFRVIANYLDKGRIEEYLRMRGCRVMSIKWTPFGTGWFGEKNARIYTVRYYDGNEKFHISTCKTSMFAGVYFTD